MGKVTLVTGATAGMRKAIALFLAGKGYEVYAGARNSADGEAGVSDPVFRVIEDGGSPIRTPAGVEAETFVPMAKQQSDEAFEAKVKEIFGL